MASRNRSPYLSSFAGPTPRISPSASTFVGRRTAISASVRSGKTTYAGTWSSRAIVRRRSRSRRAAALRRRRRVSGASSLAAIAALGTTLLRRSRFRGAGRARRWRVPLDVVRCRGSCRSPRTRSRGRVAEVAQHEAAPAAAGVRVLLHRVELREFGAPPPVERVPVDRERGERLARGSVERSAAAACASTRRTGAILQRVEQRRDAVRAAESRRQAVEIDRGARRRALRRRRATSRAEARAPASRPVAELALDALAAWRAVARCTRERRSRARFDARRACVRMRSADSTSRSLDLARARRDAMSVGGELDASRSASRSTQTRRRPSSTSARSGYAPLMKNSWVKRSGKAWSRYALGRLAVAAGAPRFLIVRLERARHGVMDDQPHVRLVDPHAERVRRDDRAHAAPHERVLHVAAMRVVEPGVIRRRRRRARARAAARCARRPARVDA